MADKDITFQQFLSLCAKYEEAWVFQEGCIFIWKDGAIKVVKANLQGKMVVGNERP